MGETSLACATSISLGDRDARVLLVSTDPASNLVAAGIFGVVSVLVIADLTQGSGRFNLTIGAISTAVGIGASLSQVIAGSIVHPFGSNAGFLFLAAVASVAFTILYFFMPESRDKQFLNPTP